MLLGLLMTVLCALGGESIPTPAISNSVMYGASAPVIAAVRDATLWLAQYL